ncbi:heme oxygenase (biliverdin-producing) [uncultured Agrococcus sp.]|uniref:biliverdin-producing heme oxygenase n=1 Tax=uncultured Agrococcus sp. TaxID=382258 RepID=UPI0025EDC947|nr:biliverdin-producing heme oxygenase [uncultured Agrococcus sp.]
MSRTSTRNAADIPMDELPVSGLLRAATSKAHESAETASLIGKLMSGQLGIEAWQLMLEQLDYVYRALETTANEMRDGDQCTELLYAELDRAESIAHDLRALQSRTGVAPIGMLASTREYVDRILSCRNDGVRYVAHHYTRYLGDLSGGQIMRVKFKEHYGLQDHEATFFRFEHIDSGPRFKKRYREHLDALDLDDAGRERIVAEANASFVCNQRIFEELDEIISAKQRAA